MLRLKSEKIREEIEELQKALKIVEAEEASLSDAQRLAIDLHALRCHRNQNDGSCAWEYENSWDCGEHFRYLQMANSLMDIVEFSRVEEILDILYKR